MYHHWTPEQVEWLRKNYMKPDDILASFLDKPRLSIVQKRQRLGLIKRMNPKVDAHARIDMVLSHHYWPEPEFKSKTLKRLTKSNGKQPGKKKHSIDSDGFAPVLIPLGGVPNEEHTSMLKASAERVVLW